MPLKLDELAKSYIVTLSATSYLLFLRKTIQTIKGTHKHKKIRFPIRTGGKSEGLEIRVKVDVKWFAQKWLQPIFLAEKAQNSATSCLEFFQWGRFPLPHFKCMLFASGMHVPGGTSHLLITSVRPGQSGCGAHAEF